MLPQDEEDGLEAILRPTSTWPIFTERSSDDEIEVEKEVEVEVEKQVEVEVEKEVEVEVEKQVEVEVEKEVEVETRIETKMLPQDEEDEMEKVD